MRTQPISIICDVLLDPYIYYFLHASSEMSCHIIHRRWNVELKSLVNDNIVTVSEQNL